MAEIYEMFAGRMSSQDVLEAARKTSVRVPKESNEHKLQLYFAYLYIGLHHEMLGEKEAAMESMKRAAEHNPLGKTGFMGQVARVHLERRTATTEKE